MNFQQPGGAVIVLPRDIFLKFYLFYFFYFFYLHFFVLERHKNFHDHSEFFDKYRTFSTFFKFAPPFLVLGGAFFNILMHITSRILHTLSQNLDWM